MTENLYAKKLLAKADAKAEVSRKKRLRLRLIQWWLVRLSPLIIIIVLALVQIYRQHLKIIDLQSTIHHLTVHDSQDEIQIKLKLTSTLRNHVKSR